MTPSASNTKSFSPRAAKPLTGVPALVFPALSALGVVAHAFTLRAADTEAGEPNQRAIRDSHEAVLNSIGFSRLHLAVGEQVHDNKVVLVTERPELPIAGVDGLVTASRGLPLGVYVADCNAIFIVDRAKPAIALLHSGKLGTQKNIVGSALSVMQERLGTRPSDCLAVLSPSIGPCHYEMDIWGGIESQLKALGVTDIVNPRICTACHVNCFYSYRAEKGKTGRMLAVLALT